MSSVLCLPQEAPEKQGAASSPSAGLGGWGCSMCLVSYGMSGLKHCRSSVPCTQIVCSRGHYGDINEQSWAVLSLLAPDLWPFICEGFGSELPGVEALETSSSKLAEDLQEPYPNLLVQALIT